MERNEKEEVSAGTVSDNTVIPGGMPIGIYLETEGVMVLGTEKVTGTDGERLEPARHLVKAGDYIVECNGTKIRDKKELQTILKTTDGTDVILKLRRDSEYLEVKVKPVRSKKNNCMLGIWVRDNANFSRQQNVLVINFQMVMCNIYREKAAFSTAFPPL